MAENNSSFTPWLMVRRSLSARRGRMAMVFAALSVSAAVVCAMLAVYLDINAKMSRELRTFGANFYLGPGGGEPLMLESDFRAIVSGAPAGLVLAACPWLHGAAYAGARPVVLAGVNFEALPPLTAFWRVTGARVAVDFDDRNAMLGAKLAAQLETSAGGEVTLARADGQRKKLRVKGVVEAGDATDSALLVNLALAQEWLAQPGQISHALLRVDAAPGRAEQWASELQRQHPRLDFKLIHRVSAAEGRVLEKIKGLMSLVALTVLALATLCVNTTLTASVSERAAEFALQKALGARPAAIMRQILAETSLAAAAAGVTGGALDCGLAQIFGRAVFASSIGLGHRLSHLPGTLSGGEQQRVYIARALVNEPPLLFADEPTGNLDEENEQTVLSLLEALHRQRRTIILVTHNPALAARADRTIRLHHGRVV